jgi:hypothetical protein
MSERPIEPKEYFAKLLTIPEEGRLEGCGSPPSGHAEEFRAIKKFIGDRRKGIQVPTQKRMAKR